MTYTQKDRSIQDGEPVEFYKFIGPFGEFRYTSDNVPGTCDGDIYLPIEGGIDRTSIETGSIVDTIMTMDFRLPADSELAKLYCYKTTPDQILVEVRRAHRGDDWNTEFEMEWKGYGLGTSVSGHLAVIQTGSVLQSKLRGNVASIYYQRMCNHILFDERCKMNKEDWTLTATVAKVQNQLITVNDDGTGNDQLKAGEIKVPRTGETRSIYANANNIISISYPFVDIQVGDTVELTFGCDHKRLGDCKLRFNNVTNYGGFDFIPVVNPFTDLNFDAYVTETLKQERATRMYLPPSGVRSSVG